MTTTTIGIFGWSNHIYTPNIPQDCYDSSSQKKAFDSQKKFHHFLEGGFGVCCRFLLSTNMVVTTIITIFEFKRTFPLLISEFSLPSQGNGMEISHIVAKVKFFRSPTVSSHYTSLSFSWQNQKNQVEDDASVLKCVPHF